MVLLDIQRRDAFYKALEARELARLERVRKKAEGSASVPIDTGEDLYLKNIRWINKNIEDSLRNSIIS